jgi:hypothetical protein
VGCAVLLVLQRRTGATQTNSRATAAVTWATLSLLSLGAFSTLAQFLFGTAFLSYWFYSTAYLTIYVIVVFAGAMRILLGSEVNGRTGLMLTTACVAAAAFAAPILTRSIDPKSVFFILVGVAGLFLATLTAVVLSLRPSLSAWLQNFGALMVAAVPLWVLSANPDTRHIYLDRSLSFRDAALTAEDADEFILATLRGRYPIFWYLQNTNPGAATRAHDWKIPSEGIYPLFFNDRWLNFGLFDMVWSFYYTGQVDMLSKASSFSDSNPDWLSFGCIWNFSSIVVISSYTEDERRAADRLHELFDTELALRDHLNVTHGSFNLYISVFDVVNPGRPHLQQPIRDGACAR